MLPRQTVLTRADSFKGMTQHPIVANAEQMLIVASLRQPRVKWGLIDRMIVAAKSGGLKPVVCLNKMDLLPRGRRRTPIRKTTPMRRIAAGSRQTGRACRAG